MAEVRNQAGARRPRAPRADARCCRMEVLEPRLLLSGAVTGSVWEDLDGDGVWDAEESGAPGWTVELFDADTGESVAATTTAGIDLDGDGQVDPRTEGGAYQFLDLPAGRYEVGCQVGGSWQLTSPGEHYSAEHFESDTLFSPRTIRAEFADALPAAGDATITIEARGDLDQESEYLYVSVEGAVLGEVFANDGGMYTLVTTELTLSQADLASAAADGTVTVTILPSTRVANLSGNERITVTLDYPATGRRSVEVVDGESADAGEFGLFEQARLEGAVWHDLDRDGQRSPDEPGLAGWTVQLKEAASGEVLDETVSADVDLDGDGTISADEQGRYEFDVAGPGPYALALVDQAGWQVTLEPADQPLAAGSGQVRQDEDFAVVALATVGGQVTADLDMNAFHDADEAGLDDWTVQLLDGESGAILRSTKTASVDLDGDGTIDPHTERGRYTFTDLFPGSYTVRVRVQDGWTVTSPESNELPVSPANGQTLADTDVRLSPEPGAVAGAVWDDADGNGLRDADEVGLDGVEVRLVEADTGRQVASVVTAGLDVDEDGTVDPISEAGLYRFEDLPPGDYDVRVIGPAGWTQSAGSGSYVHSFVEVDTLHSDHTTRLLFEGIGVPTSRATLTIRAIGDFDKPWEYLSLSADGVALGTLFVEDGLQYQTLIRTIDLPLAQLAPLVADGELEVTIRPSAKVDNLLGSEELRAELACHVSQDRRVVVETGQEVGDVELGLARPEVNDAPVITETITAPGGIEDEPYELAWDALDASAEGSDPDGDDLSYRVEQVPAGELTVNGQPVVAGETLLAPGDSLRWLPPTNANGPVTALRVRAWDGEAASTLSVPVEVDLAPVNDAPTLTAIETIGGLVEGEPLTVAWETLAMVANESDVDGDALGFRIEGIHTGTLTLDGQPVVVGETVVWEGQSLLWTPPAGVISTIDAFDVSAWDGELSSGTPVTVRISGGGENHAPTLTTIDTLNEAVEDTARTITFLELSSSADEADVDGQQVLFRIQQIRSGTLTKAGQPVTPGLTILAAGESVTWLPAADASGLIEAFTVVAWDGMLPSVQAVAVRLDVEAVNDAPRTVDDQASGPPDTVLLTGNVLANDIEPDGDELTITDTTPPAHGQLRYLGGGVFEIEPEAGFVGTDTFTYTVRDGEGSTATATVTLFIRPTNVPPEAIDDVLFTNEDEVGLADWQALLANDRDDNDDPLSVSDWSQPASGTLVDNEDGTFSYTPPAEFHGTDTFTYTVTDGAGGSAQGTVTINVAPVNDAPVGGADLVATVEDTPVTIDDLLANDTDVDGDELTIAAVHPPEHGRVQWTPGEAVIYEPDADVTGSDAFTYIVSDGRGGMTVVSVSVTIEATNDAPQARPDVVRTDEDVPAELADLLANDLDVDGDALVIDGVTQPAHGTVTFADAGTLRYEPDENFFGQDTFTYTIRDGQGGWDEGEVTVIVEAVNDAPHPVDDQLLLAEDAGPVELDVLANDFDADGDVLYVQSFTPPARGRLSYLGGGRFAYEPNPDEYGSDAFTCTISDGRGLVASSTVHVTITPVNDAPRATDDAFELDEGSELVLPDLTDNDTDADGDPLTVTIHRDPSHGRLRWTDAGRLIYQPAEGFSGTDTFAYTVRDPSGASDEGRVTLEVAEVNDPPRAGDDAVTVPAGETMRTASVLANDTDPEGRALTVVAFTQPAAGEAVYNGDGTFTIIAPPSAGATSFTYTVADGDGGRSEATVHVTIAEPQVAAVTAEIGDAGPRVLIFTDADGSTVVVALAGGSATCEMNGEDVAFDRRGRRLVVTGRGLGLERISLSGTTPASRLVVRVGRGDGRVQVGSVTGDGPVGLLVAPAMDLVGGGIDLGPTGWVGRLAIGDLADGADLRLGGQPTRPVVISAGRVGRGSRWQLGGSAAVVVAREMSDVDLSADSIGRLVIAGHRPSGRPGALGGQITLDSADGAGWSLRQLVVAGAVEAELSAAGKVGGVRTGSWQGGGIEAESLLAWQAVGDVDASLRLTDPGTRAMGRVRVIGDLAARNWQVAGGAGVIAASGSVTGTVRTGGSLAAMVVGAANELDVLVGLSADAVPEQLTLGELENPSAELGVFAVRGLGGKGRADEAFVRSSSLSAGSMGVVDLLNPADASACRLRLPVSQESDLPAVRVVDLPRGRRWQWPGRQADVQGSPLSGLLEWIEDAPD